MADTIRWFDGELRNLLASPGGAVGKFLGREGVRISNRAKVNATGPPHGYYAGRYYPSAPGRGPGVRTGRGRASISWAIGADGTGIALFVGTNVNYMAILELRSHAPYPWLIPALQQCGYSVRKL